MGVLQLIEVHDAEVHAADGHRVVVDQPDPMDPARATDADFLLELPPQRGLVGIDRPSPLGILFGDVAPDAERPEPMEAGLALRSPPLVAEDPIARAKDDVRDDLLVARILLDLRPRSIV